MKNAVLMASGMGTRMRPLTNHTPKPLIEVCGKPMIETIIDGLCQAGVNNIYIVTGFLREKFNYLVDKYPQVTLIENTDYETVNNISSIYAAREQLGQADCFICEADLYVSDTTIFSYDLTDSCYYGRMVEGHSDDWVFEQDESGVITRVGKIGDDCYNMVGVAFFKQREASIIADAITQRYRTDGYEDLFWDDVVNECLDKLQLTIQPVSGEQIVEIDTVDELEEVNRRFNK